MHSFYEPNAQAHSRVELNEQEAAHATKVLRLRDGDALLLLDGNGNSYVGQVEIAGRKWFVQTQEALFHEPAEVFLELVLAPTKNADRTEWVVEKAVEIGVQAISFIRCDHSERVHLRMDRLQRLAISAMKQSHKYYVPTLNDMVDFNDWMSQHGQVEMAMAHCNTAFERVSLNLWSPSTKRCAILIGPEGDFSAREIQEATQRGASGVHLGSERLRTETAALVAVSTFAWKRNT
jgi:16S rRNA (uracil1498-N3)-methyltransferase